MAELLAWLQKELRVELRGKHGLLTAALFGVVAVAAMTFASTRREPPGNIAAGMLTVTLLFSGVVAIPRLFLVEDDQQTIELMRLMARPTAMFGGKLLFAMLQMIFTCIALTILFVVLANLTVDWGLAILGAVLEGATLAIGLCATSALAIGASNRWVLAGAVGLPVLLPQSILCQGIFYASFSTAAPIDAPRNALGLAFFAIAMVSLVPWVIKQLYELDRGSQVS